jgi:hypothetical protein
MIFFVISLWVWSCFCQVCTGFIFTLGLHMGQDSWGGTGQRRLVVRSLLFGAISILPCLFLYRWEGCSGDLIVPRILDCGSSGLRDHY